MTILGLSRRGFRRAGRQRALVDVIPGLGSFFVFASISGYQNVNAATTIAVLVASQLIGGLALGYLRVATASRVYARNGRAGVWRAVAGHWRMADCEAPVLMGLQYRAAFGELLAARVPILLDIACRDARWRARKRCCWHSVFAT